MTGLIAIDTADHFTAFGQGVVAVLIQIGGLGVTSVGVGLMIAAGKKVSLRGRVLVKESLKCGYVQRNGTVSQSHSSYDTVL